VARRVGQVRKELGFPTMFNLLGPLLNPAGATHQVVGTSSEDVGRKLASLVEFLPGLNIVTLFNSMGFDELLPTGINHLYRWSDGHMSSEEVEIPQIMRNGFVPEAVLGGDRRRNLEIMLKVLSGEESYYSKVTMLNAALGLVHVEKAKNLGEGLALSEESLMGGAALSVFNKYVTMSKEAS
jgi:anthranilate phosphoribosyltransferase